MIEYPAEAIYTCDLCSTTERVDPREHPTPNWTILPTAHPLHLCRLCSGQARRLFALLSIPFDFEDRDHLVAAEFNILKLRDLSALFSEPVIDEKVTRIINAAPTITWGWQAQLGRIRVALNAALEELDDNEGDPRPCIEYALGQLRKLGLFGGLKEKERSDGC